MISRPWRRPIESSSSSQHPHKQQQHCGVDDHDHDQEREDEREMAQTKGCKTCRSRKIKCDLGQPECQRCFTTGRKCGGYNHETTFKVARSHDWASRSKRKPRVNHGVARSSKSVLSARTTTTTDTNDALRLPAAPDQMTTTCEQLGGCFSSLFYPLGHDPAGYVFVPGGWVALFPGFFHGRGSLLNKSLVAFYAGFVGQRMGDADLIDRGRELYVDALHCLQKSDIWTGTDDVKQLDLVTTMASIITFSRCELFTVQAGDGGYMAHIRGGLRLLRQYVDLLPPDNDLTRIIVQKFRIYGFYATARHHEPLFMAEAPFDSLYLARPSDTDYILQRGFEAMISFPNVQHEADRLDADCASGKLTPMQGEIKALKLLSQASTVYKRLQRWHAELREAIPAPKQVHTAMASVDACDEQFPNNLMCYSAPGHQYLWILYWLFSLYLHLLIKQIQDRYTQLQKGSCRERTEFPLAAGLLGMALSFEVLDRYADNIRSSLFCSYKHSFFEAQESLAPVLTLQWYYERRGFTVKAQWCIQIIKGFEGRGVAVNLDVKETPGACPTARAGFLAE